MKALTKWGDGRNYDYMHTPEACNACVCQLGGWPTGSLDIFVWSTEKRRYAVQLAGFPAIATVKGTLLELERHPLLKEHPMKCNVSDDKQHAMMSKLPYFDRGWALDRGFPRKCFRGIEGPWGNGIWSRSTSLHSRQ